MIQNIVARGVLDEDGAAACSAKTAGFLCAAILCLALLFAFPAIAWGLDAEAVDATDIAQSSAAADDEAESAASTSESVPASDTVSDSDTAPADESAVPTEPIEQAAPAATDEGTANIAHETAEPAETAETAVDSTYDGHEEAADTADVSSTPDEPAADVDAKPESASEPAADVETAEEHAEMVGEIASVPLTTQAVATAKSKAKTTASSARKSITYAKSANAIYTGKKLTPKLTVKCGSKKLKAGVDFTATYKRNVKTGKAVIIIKGIGKYKGTKKITFRIYGKPQYTAGATKLPIYSYTMWKLKNAKIKVISGKKYVKVKGTKVTAKKAGSSKIAVYNKLGKKIATKNVTVYKFMGSVYLKMGEGSNLYLDAASGDSVKLAKKSKKDTQHFVFKTYKSSSYTITSKSSGKALQARKSNGSYTSDLALGSTGTAKAKRWKVEVDSSNRLILKSVATGKAIGVAKGTSAVGKAVELRAATTTGSTAVAPKALAANCVIGGDKLPVGSTSAWDVTNCVVRISGNNGVFSLKNGVMSALKAGSAKIKVYTTMGTLKASKTITVYDMNSEYYISSAASPGKVLDVDAWLTQNHGNIILFGSTGLVNQKYAFERQADNSYKIRSLYSGNYLQQSHVDPVKEDPADVPAEPDPTQAESVEGSADGTTGGTAADDAEGASQDDGSGEAVQGDDPGQTEDPGTNDPVTNEPGADEPGTDDPTPVDDGYEYIPNNVEQFEALDDAHQTWRIEVDKGNFLTFVNVATGLAMALDGGKTKNETSIVVGAPEGTKAQKFYAVDINLKLMDGKYNTLAVYACRYAYSQPRYYQKKASNTGTTLYKTVTSAIFPGYVQMSCDRGVAVAARWSGVDIDYPPGTPAQYKYLMKSSDWKYLGHWSGEISDLQPGDVLIRVTGMKDKYPNTKYNHTCVYVGTDTAMAVYNTYIKGTDGDLGAPTPDACFVSAHRSRDNINKASAACIGNAAFAHADNRMVVFRCTNPNNSIKYSYLA